MTSFLSLLRCIAADRVRSLREERLASSSAFPSSLIIYAPYVQFYRQLNWVDFAAFAEDAG